ncbi:MAG: TetR/AcrR family transcriptional regulator [Opitutaceae bacterium]|nr:TetR/AcrR family transcriptional regulator [Opitutaceae bacterium]
MNSDAEKVIRRRNPDRTKRRLLQAAIRLFSEKGYHGVSVDEIVAKAKSNKRMVYHYYGSKNDIYLAALVDVLGRLESVEFQAVVAKGRADQQLRDLLVAYFKFLDANPEFYRLLLWENLERGRHMARSASKLSKNPFTERFRLIIEDGVRQGIFRAPADIRHLLVNFIGLCFIYYSNYHSLKISVGLDMDSPKVREMRVTQVVDLAFHGLLRK